MLTEREREIWMEQAACRSSDPNFFFPDRGESTEPAKLICRTCPVKAECREFAIVNRERFGVWGGFSDRERRRIAQSRRRPDVINARIAR